jgi:osmotically-inducible protein OsmY
MKPKLITTIAALTTAAAALSLPAGAAPGDAGAHLLKTAASQTEAAESQPLKDTYLKGKIMGALAVNPNVSVFDFNVKVDSGVATIDGSVDTDIERDLAVEVARGVEDVKDVRSIIEVKPGTRKAREESRTMGQTIDDTSTTASIKGKLLANKNTSGLKINVTTKKGIVTLTGTAKSDAEKDLAGRIAENAAGVVQVDNQLTVASRP